jgi:hypothetical protein
VRARTEEYEERYRGGHDRARWRASTIRTSCACCRCSSSTTRPTW